MGLGAMGQLLSLREAYISNLSLLPSLEPIEKFVVVGGGWVVVYTKFSVKLEPKLNNSPQCLKHTHKYYHILKHEHKNKYKHIQAMLVILDFLGFS